MKRSSDLQERWAVVDEVIALGLDVSLSEVGAPQPRTRGSTQSTLGPPASRETQLRGHTKVETASGSR